jgi:hypothetical protein
LIAHSTCIGCGVAMYTASTVSSASRSSYEPCLVAMSYLSANSPAEAIDRLPTATTSLVGDVGTWLANRDAMFPVPMIPQRSFVSGAVKAVVSRQFVGMGQNFMAPAAMSAMKWRPPMMKTPISGMTLIKAPAITVE